MNNYRPISILPYFSKLFHKIMYTRLYDYISKLGILYPDQHGFQPNHSTDMPLLNIYDKISLAFDNNEYALGVFLGLSQGSDTVNHKILSINWNYTVFGASHYSGSKTICSLVNNKYDAMASYLAFSLLSMEFLKVLH